MTRQVDATEGIDAQPSANDRLGKRPHQQRRLTKRPRQIQRHRAIGEGRLRHQQHIDIRSLQFGDARIHGGRVHDQVPRADELVTVIGDGGVKLRRDFPRQFKIEGRPGDGRETDADIGGVQRSFSISE